MNKITDCSYEERAGAMTKSARRVLCTDAGAAWQKARHAAENIGELEILTLNKMREAGLKINQACGREQLLFTLAGKKFARREILPLLPEDMDMKALQACVHIANAVPEPIQTRDQLKSVKQELQLAFVAFGLIDAPSRKELGNPHARNLFSDFVNRTTGLALLFDELERVEPMEHWPADKLDEFLEIAQPMKLKIQQAEKLRLGFRPGLPPDQFTK